MHFETGQNNSEIVLTAEIMSILLPIFLRHIRNIIIKIFYTYILISSFIYIGYAHQFCIKSSCENKFIPLVYMKIMKQKHCQLHTLV